MFNWVRTHKLVTSIFILAILGGWYFYGQNNKVEYEEYSVSRQTVKDTLELSGKVKALNSASLRFLAGGLLTYLGPKEGESVKKWQTLASVDSRGLQKVMEQKLNLYAIQRDTFDQTVDDHDNSVPAGDLGNELKRLLEKNQYQLDNTIKDVEYQDLSLRLTKLVSPIEGILVQSPTTTANVQVSATDVWLVVDPSSLYFSADLDETDLNRVTTGQPAHVTLDAFPDIEINSTISTISFAPKETTTGTTYEVKVGLKDVAPNYLRLGLNGTVELVMDQVDNALTIPMTALTSKGSSSYVTVKNGKKYQEIEIKTGIQYNGVVEIKSGLGEADHVYIKK